MDKKNKTFGILEENQIINESKSSKVYFTNRIKVEWGGYSQIRTELLLLNYACQKGTYDYYHLISGQDLPIKTNYEINRFLEKHSGKEFISSGPLLNDNVYHDLDRVRYYHWFQNSIGKSTNKIPLRFLRKVTLHIQKKIGVYRNRGVNFKRGDNWFSITDDCARYILSKKSEIYKIFKYSFCADELFVQTIIAGTSFEERIYNSKNSLRFIDWKRAQPWTWRLKDFNLLSSTSDDYLFARKFDADIDKKIIDKICDYLNEKNKLDD